MEIEKRRLTLCSSASSVVLVLRDETTEFTAQRRSLTSDVPLVPGRAIDLGAFPT